MDPRTVSLAEIVVQRPEAAQVFARHKLDFCCHGQRSLAEACEEKSLDPALVMSELGEAADPGISEEGIGKRPLDEIIEYILARYHQPLRRDLTVLLEQARIVEKVHAGKEKCPRGLAELLAHIVDAVENHLQKEEEILFPMILSGRGSMAFMPIKVMEQEHEEHGANLARIRELTGDLIVPPEACATWKALYQGLAAVEQDLFRHIHLENYVLFPRALAGERPLPD